MARLNITFGGLSADYPVELDGPISDADLKRIAVEVVRSGQVPGLHLPAIGEDAFEHFVVDRLDGGRRLYLRPKVPFGA
jgi:hypothetical protein